MFRIRIRITICITTPESRFAWRLRVWIRRVKNAEIHLVPEVKTVPEITKTTSKVPPPPRTQQWVRTRNWALMDNGKLRFYYLLPVMLNTKLGPLNLAAKKLALHCQLFLLYVPI